MSQNGDHNSNDNRNRNAFFCFILFVVLGLTFAEDLNPDGPQKRKSEIATTQTNE